MNENWTEDERYERWDLPFYEKVAAPILPPEVLDFHAHVWTRAHWKRVPWDANAPGARYMVTETEYSIEALQADAHRIFAGRTYKAVCFGNPTPAADLDATNDYVAQAGRLPGIFPLMIVGRDTTPRERILERIGKDGFFGYKVFLNWFGDDYGHVRIEDMLGPAEMEIANEYRLIVLLHVPRSGRLADPEVQRGVRALSRDYPDAQIVLAHCGRCYLPDEMKEAIGAVSDLGNVYMDTAMHMEPHVFETILRTLGPRRLLFATDFPVANMRGRRVYVMDHWVDLVLAGYPESAYRVQSNNIRATFMAYEIVAALRRAAEQAGISRAELGAIFHDNGMELLRRVRRP